VLEERRRWVVVYSRRKPPDDLVDKNKDELERKQADVFAEEVGAGAVLVIGVFFYEDIQSVGQAY
jgi:hypothetical protein